MNNAVRSHYNGYESVHFSEEGLAFSVEFLFAQWWHVGLFHEPSAGAFRYHSISDYTANTREQLLELAHEKARAHARLVHRSGNCLGRVPIVLTPRGVIHIAMLGRGRTFCGKPLPEGEDELALAPSRQAGRLCRVCPAPLRS